MLKLGDGMLETTAMWDVVLLPTVVLNVMPRMEFGIGVHCNWPIGISQKTNRAQC